MSHQQNITDVLVVGATGSIGRVAVAAAQRHGLRPRALVRDVRRAERLLPGVDLVQGDLEDPASLRAAVQGVDAMLLAHGSDGDSRPDARAHIDHGGVRNLLRALDGARPRVARSGKTFELTATEGEEPADWAELFGILETDRSGSVDGVLDPADLPVEAEPQPLRADLDAVRSLGGPGS